MGKVDFGTTVKDKEMLFEREDEITGTPPYMAPDTLRTATFDKPVDVWAYGCVLAHVATGRAPYSQLKLSKVSELLDVIRKGEASPLELLLASNTTPSPIITLARLGQALLRSGPQAASHFQQHCR